MLAYAMQRQEQERMASYQAWMSNLARSEVNKGSKKNPKIEPRFKYFKELYDEQAEFRRLFNPDEPKKTKKLSIADKNMMLSKKREEENNG